ncbi:hypothetical protein [Burkholderia cepacia]|nr:hypothetical protein [Burkholderia cepacia]
MLNLIPVVGIAAPIYFVGGAITIGAALCTHLRKRRAEPGPARA